jgi:hypothetical protein
MRAASATCTAARRAALIPGTHVVVAPRLPLPAAAPRTSSRMCCQVLGCCMTQQPQLPKQQRHLKVRRSAARCAAAPPLRAAHDQRTHEAQWPVQRTMLQHPATSQHLPCWIQLASLPCLMAAGQCCCGPLRAACVIPYPRCAPTALPQLSMLGPTITAV